MPSVYEFVRCCVYLNCGESTALSVTRREEMIQNGWRAGSNRLRQIAAVWWLIVLAAVGANCPIELEAWPSADLLAAGATVDMPPQTPARDASREKPRSSLGGLRGVVVAADSRRPLRLARVLLSGSSLEHSQVTSTDEGGRYEFRDLPAGRYTVTADRSGYLKMAFGERRPGGSARPLEIGEGQILQNVDFALPRMSVISGYVTDEIGDPVDHSTVTALRARYSVNGKQLTKVSIAQTDASGFFRILNLPPGDYLVQASTSETWTVERDGRRETVAYAAMYFPTVFRPEDARAVRVGLGQEVQDIDTSLTRSHTVNIRGRVLSSVNPVFSRTTVYLSQEFVTSANGIMGGKTTMVGSSPIAADGTFQMSNVPPGTYKLQVKVDADAGGPPEVASVEIVAFDADIDDLVLITSQGGHLRGVVQAESGTLPPSETTMRVVASQTVQTLMPLPVSPDNGKVDRAGMFELTGLFPPCVIRMTGLPKGWAVKSVYVDSREVTDTRINEQVNDQSTARVVLTDRLPSVGGSVVDSGGKRVNDYTVIAFSTNVGQVDDSSRLVRAARADQDGNFQIKDLPVGTYWFVALDDVEPEQWWDPAFREEIRQLASSVSVQEGENKMLTLELSTR